MQTTDIGNKEDGKIWHRKPAPSPSNNGVMVTIIQSATAYHSRTVRFLQVAFDATGQTFLAGDHHGNIYVFDIGRNRFKLIQKTGQACTAMAFNLRRTTEYLVALADYSIKCFDKDTRQLVSWMRGHDGAVSSMSVHSSGRYAITTSADAAQLWDLDTFQRKRKLNVRQAVGIRKVFFLPRSNTILSCFSDDTIFAWESDTLYCKYQLPTPGEGPKMGYRAFVVTRDGRILAAGGRSGLLHLWCLDSQQLLRTVQMPSQVRTVRQLEFLPDSFDGGSSQVLGVLSQDGIMRFINIHSCELLFEVCSHDDGIASAAISPSGRHLVTVMESGALNIYSVQALTRDIKRPPAPLVKVVTTPGQADGSSMTARVPSKSVWRPTRTSGRKVQTRASRPPVTSLPEDKENEMPDPLNKKRLQALLKTFGEYPARYRMFIWRSLLHLPENCSAFSSLTDKGRHSAFVTLQERYPVKSARLQRGLHRVLSALAHWSAIFGETEYLPLLAFPFVKLFQNNPLICFEVIATVIVNWCQHWFEYFPNPPLNVLSMVENVLAHHDKELLQHLVHCGVTSQLYAWPLLETLFSEVLTRDEWLKLFDNVFSNHPAFLLLAAASYVTCSRAPLLLCTRREDFQYFFHHRNNLDMGAVIRGAYQLMENTPEEIHPQNLLADFEPLTQGQYPIFNKYPTFVVEYRTQERERIRQQELEYLRERQALQELRAEAVLRRAEDEARHAQQELLREEEERRRRRLRGEEERLAEQRRRLAAMKRELKAKELHLLDAARRRRLHQQQEQKRAELRRLDEEIERKASLRVQETAAAVQDVEVRQMELQAQRRLLEQQLAKEQERVTQEVRAEAVAWQHHAEEEDESAYRRLLEGDPNCGLGIRKALEESLAEAEQLQAEAELREEVLGRLEQADAERVRERRWMAARAAEADASEEQLIEAMKKMESRKWEEVERRTQQEDEAQAGRRTLGMQNQKEQRCGDEGQKEQRCGDEGQSLDVCWSPCSPRRHEAAPPQREPDAICLSGRSSTESVPFSLDRCRAELDCRERELMRDVQELRRKLAARANAGTPSL